MKYSQAVLLSLSECPFSLPIETPGWRFSFLYGWELPIKTVLISFVSLFFFLLIEARDFQVWLFGECLGESLGCQCSQGCFAGWLRVEGTSGDHLVRPLCQAQPPTAHVAQDCIQVGFEYLHRKTPQPSWV